MDTPSILKTNFSRASFTPTPQRGLRGNTKSAKGANPHLVWGFTRTPQRGLRGNTKSAKGANPHLVWGFTLVELLIVIGIVSVVSIVVIITLNPADLLKQARDSRRISELNSINSALQLFEFDVLSGYMGDPESIYISIVDPGSATCANLSLPPLPTPWQYVCSIDPADHQKVDGTGWIRVNFTQVSIGAPLFALPIDPINDASRGLYYTYTTGGSWKLTSLLESERKHDIAINDGGDAPGVYEIGTDLTLASSTIDLGLIGNWRFEGTSAEATLDSSGNGNDLTSGGGITFTTGKMGQAANFPGSGSYATSTMPLNPVSSHITAMTWFNTIDSATWQTLIHQQDDGGGGIGRIWLSINGGSCGGDKIFTYLNFGGSCLVGTTQILANTWYHAAVTSDLQTINLYLNGELEVSSPATPENNDGSHITIAAFKNISGAWFTGRLDEVRIYERALSEDEIRSIYNATK